MPQSKRTKKKKSKGRKNGKKKEAQKVVEPTDKKAEARNNVKKMILKAHEIHNDYKISKCGLKQLLVSGYSSRENKYPNSVSNNFNALHQNFSNVKPLKKQTMETAKISSRVSEQFSKPGTSNTVVRKDGRISIEFSEPKKRTPQRQASAEYPRRKKTEISKRRVSAEYPTRNTEEVTHPTKMTSHENNRISHLEAPTNKKHRGKTRRRQQSNTGSKIKDYQLGTLPYVSLEMLDNAKFKSSNVSLGKKKSILRQNKNIQRPQGSAGSKSNKSGLKNKQQRENKHETNREKEGQNEGVANVKDKKSNDRVKFQTRTNQNHPEPATIPKSSGMTKILKKGAKENKTKILESLFSRKPSNSALINLFNSNIRQSHISSDSDVSKIDKKFLRILEAVTLNKLTLNFDNNLRKNKRERPKTNERDSTVNIDTAIRRGAKESTQKKSVISLPNVRTKDVSKTPAKSPKSQNSEEIQSSNLKPEKSPSTDDKPRNQKSKESNVALEGTHHASVHELWLKGNSDSASTDTKSEKQCTLPQVESPESLKGVQTPIFNTVNTNKSEEEVIKVQNSETGSKTNECKLRNESKTKKEFSKKHEKLKSNHWPESSRDKSKINQETVKSAAKSKADNKKRLYRKVKTWSIIKRLEKALQSLGLNLNDIESSDDDSSTLSEKKNRAERPVGRESNANKKETRKKKTNTESSNARKSSNSRNNFETYDSENGSGDKHGGKDVQSDIIRTTKDKGETCKCVYFVSTDHAYKDNNASHNELSQLFSTKISKLGMTPPPSRGIMQLKTSRMAISAENISDNLFEERTKTKKCKKQNNLEDLETKERRTAKRKSEYSLPMSSSCSSLSQNGGFNRKRKKKSFNPRRRPQSDLSEEEVWTISQKGDAEDHKDREPTPSWIYNITSPEMLKNGEIIMLNIAENKSYDILKMEEKNNELELKHLRERHKEILSDIKSSLEEIRKQHNLYSKLQKQTKRFNWDCIEKRRLIHSYLKDVEANNNRRGLKPQCEERRNTTAVEELDQYDSRMTKLRRKLDKTEISPNLVNESLLEMKTVSSFTELNEVREKIHTRFDYISSDTADERESFRSVTSSIRTTQLKYKRSTEDEGVLSNKSQLNVSQNMAGSMEMLCLQWSKQETSDESVREVPSYLIQLLEKLNGLIVMEKNQLENLVVKASGSSNSTHSDKTRLTASTNSSRNKMGKHHYSQLEERAISEHMTTSPGCKTSLTSVGNGAVRQHKAKSQSNRKPNHKTKDVNSGISMSTTLIQGDPGGSSVESIPNQESKKEFEFDRLAEEFRYRKGDPSFSFQTYHFDGEQSKIGRSRTPEERRKTELERILHVDEVKLRRFAPRETEKTERRLAKHRQPSFIIDHNRGEDNEESQTVLGHASRHIVNITKLDCRKMAKDYYLTNRQGPGRSWDTATEDLGKSIKDFSGSRTKHAFCQTDYNADFEGYSDIYLLEESTSTHSIV